MIQYPVSLRELAAMVGNRLPTYITKSGNPRKNARASWRARARQETALLVHDRAYLDDQHGEIWRELKEIFAEIQGNGKCAYCETLLSRHRRGSARGDVEHYRPKNGVEAWPTQQGITVGGSDPVAYYLLAFQLRNYLLACDVCNREFKGNYFPIAGQRCSAHSRRPRELKAERPYLPHPIDPNDDDPEQLIEFVGIAPVPRAAHGTYEYWRAMVTIDVLGLSRGSRYDLDFNRTLVISNLYNALISSDPADPVTMRTLQQLEDSSSTHLNCARSFKRLYDLDPAEAKLRADEAGKYVDKVWSQRRNP